MADTREKLPHSLTTKEGFALLKSFMDLDERGKITGFSRMEHFREKYVFYEKDKDFGCWVAKTTLAETNDGKTRYPAPIPDTSLKWVFGDVIAKMGNTWNNPNTEYMDTYNRPLFDHRLLLPPEKRKRPFHRAPADTRELADAESELAIEIDLPAAHREAIIDARLYLRSNIPPDANTLDLILLHISTPTVNTEEDWDRLLRRSAGITFFDPKFVITQAKMNNVNEAARKKARKVEPVSPLPSLPPNPMLAQQIGQMLNNIAASGFAAPAPRVPEVHPLSFLRPRIDGPCFSYFHTARTNKVNSSEVEEELRHPPKLLDEDIPFFFDMWFQPLTDGKAPLINVKKRFVKEGENDPRVPQDVTAYFTEMPNEQTLYIWKYNSTSYSSWGFVEGKSAGQHVTTVNNRVERMEMNVERVAGLLKRMQNNYAPRTLHGYRDEDILLNRLLACNEKKRKAAIALFNEIFPSEIVMTRS